METLLHARSRHPETIIHPSHSAQDRAIKLYLRAYIEAVGSLTTLCRLPFNCCCFSVRSGAVVHSSKRCLRLGRAPNQPQLSRSQSLATPNSTVSEVRSHRANRLAANVCSSAKYSMAMLRPSQLISIPSLLVVVMKYMRFSRTLHSFGYPLRYNR